MGPITKHRLRITALVLAIIIIIYTAIVLAPRRESFAGDNPMMKSTDTPLLIAHGGGNREFPDNTLEAFYNAYSVDKNVMMETDVSITRDGVVILSHDVTIDRKTNKTGYIADWNYSDLIEQEVDFGYTNETRGEIFVDGSERRRFTRDDGTTVTPLDVEYPEGVTARHDSVFLATTLEELIVSFPNNRINVEIKQEGELGIKAAKAVIELLERHDAYDRVVLASFHGEIYDEFRHWQREGLVPDSFMYSPGTSGVAEYFALYTLGLDLFFLDGVCVLQLPTDYTLSVGELELTVTLAKAGLIKNAHKHNMAVHFWTINDKDEMRRLIEMGADGIMTDYPHRLKEVYEEYEK